MLEVEIHEAVRLDRPDHDGRRGPYQREAVLERIDDSHFVTGKVLPQNGKMLPRQVGDESALKGFGGVLGDDPVVFGVVVTQVGQFREACDVILD